MKPRSSLLLLIALVALIGSIWLYIAFLTPPQQTLDRRVYEIAEQLKCPVCQNESVASSSASVANEMRQAIRQKLQSGWSEQQVLDYFAAHYGSQILLTPPQQGFNLLAWLTPVAMLMLGLGLAGFVAYDWNKQAHLQTTTQPGQQVEGSSEDAELEQYRVQLERELADDNPLFG